MKRIERIYKLEKQILEPESKDLLPSIAHNFAMIQASVGSKNTPMWAKLKRTMEIQDDINKRLAAVESDIKLLLDHLGLQKKEVKKHTKLIAKTP